eukprot:351182-Chlamydomonas_euryale.AAC.2
MVWLHNVAGWCGYTQHHGHQSQIRTPAHKQATTHGRHPCTHTPNAPVEEALVALLKVGQVGVLLQVVHLAAHVEQDALQLHLLRFGAGTAGAAAVRRASSRCSRGEKFVKHPL